MCLVAFLLLLASPAHAQPQRIVSLDFCADQYVLRLAAPDQIAAVSRGAGAMDSYERARARGVPSVRATMEEVAPLRPDLVVRSFGGGPALEAALARRNVTILNVGWSENIAQVLTDVRRVSTAFGRQAEGEAFARQLEARRAALARNRPRAQSPVLYLTPGGVTAGRNTMVDAIFREAGAVNAEEGAGWRPAPLERLVARQPERVVLSFFDLPAARADGWSAARHPVMRRIVRETPSVSWPAAWTACPTWGALDAAEALQRALPR
ncbi:MAG: ABC transporter substrate-binding protein [Hyphomonadaceae bacterium]